MRRGIVEIADDSTDTRKATHFLLHHAVICMDKTTSKLRIVFDASAKSSGPSLNNCLYTGPSFGQFIWDILLRFCAHEVALAEDVEKGFLMVGIELTDCDFLKFLWVENTTDDPPKILTLHFTRVVFGVKSSTFLLNATIEHHMQTYKHSDPSFDDNFLSSIC